MIRVTAATTLNNGAMHPTLKNDCVHGRIVDAVRTSEGIETGHLICLECLAVFPDPLIQDQVH
ncbi:MAG TPA: hypothetical protein VKP13_14415 [Nitrospira sp.]|nr:hypothetical protein [Nitrospira sp.]